MSRKNTLANKKRKKTKFDATSGSISGYLLSSSDKVDANNSDNSLDSTELSSSSKSTIKGRLSHEFDESFDLFVSKKIAKYAQQTTIIQSISPVKNSESSSKIGSPRGKSKVSKDIRNSPKNKIIKKCGYFNNAQNGSQSIPCPFCFQFEDNIYDHMTSSCIRRGCINDKLASELLQIHCDYWNQRRQLGIPDVTLNEDEVFKTNSNINGKKMCIPTESAIESKTTVLKWSKAKTNKYLLLRQTQTEREYRITQKLAIVLMGVENENRKEEDDDSETFKTVDKSIKSDYLEQLLCKEITFWKKSSLCSNQGNENVDYAEALSTFIIPVEKKNEINFPPVSKIDSECSSKDKDDSIPASPLKDCLVNSSESQIQVQKLFSDQKSPSQMKDSCFTEINSSEFVSVTSKDNHSELSLGNDWDHLFNSSDFSDVTVVFHDGRFLAHSLVFWVRSIGIFSSISSGSSDECGKLLDWSDVSSLVGKAFIRFIYSDKMDHFNEMSIKDLKSVERLFDKYNSKMKTFITNLISTKSGEFKPISPEPVIVSSGSNPVDLGLGERNLTSPDMFDDLNSSHSSEMFASSNSLVKRKLELSPNNIYVNDSIKRLKTETTDLKASDEVDENQFKLTIITDKSGKDDASSVGSVDAISLCSTNSISSLKTIKRPISQCSTLPPLSESPKAIQDDVPSPLTLPFKADSPNSHHIAESKPDDLNSSEDNFYFDNDTFDYNAYIGASHIDDLEDVNENESSPQNSLPNKPEDPSVIQPHKKSLDINFDDSLPLNYLEDIEVIESSQFVSNVVKGSPICQSTPTRPVVTNNTTTPSPQILVSDQATPLLNYSTLISPELRGELKKYGLKPNMNRKTAKTLLRYIYELIHPVVPSEQEEKVETSIIDKTTVEDSENNNPQTLTENGLDNQEKKADTSSESLLIFDNEDSDHGIEFDFDCNEEPTCTQDSSSYQTKNELIQSVSDFIKKDAVLFESILQYVPVWLSKFHKAIKENGIKCTKTDLMDVLDELCVTFRTERKVKEKHPKR